MGQGGFGGGMGGFGGGMMPGGQGGQRPQGQGMVQGGFGGGQGGQRASVTTISQIQEKFPDEYKAAQELRQKDPAAYREKMRELQQKLNAGN